MNNNKPNEESNQEQVQDDEVDDIKAKPIATKLPSFNKRSSLKKANLSPIRNIPKKGKRGSVNWDMSSDLDNIKSMNIKEMKISFKQEAPNQDKRKFSDFNLANFSKEQKKFNDARKNSIKNEFTLVKQLMKTNPIEELEIEEEAIENTKKNKEIGQKGVEDLSDSDSNSDHDN